MRPCRVDAVVMITRESTRRASARRQCRVTQAKSPYFFSIDYDPATMNMSAITVPTSETCSVAFWMTDLVKRHRPVMLAGPSGTGKTQQVNGILKAMDPAAFLSATINFNFYTTSAVLGNTMCLPLEKKTGTNFGPPGIAHLVYFVDDLNLPEVDKYMTQSAIALLRQQMEYGHIYDMTKLAQNPVSDSAWFSFNFST